jgi:ferredoxin--NADP+ reductase
MYKILKKRVLNTAGTAIEMVIQAPLVARKCLAGQFIIFRLDEYGERIPLTIAGFDRENGTVTIMFQPVGRSTSLLAKLEEGDEILDFAGPLGKPSEIDGLSRVAVVGGGVGCAIAYPVAKAMDEKGIDVDMIAGFKTHDLMMLEEEMSAASKNLYICTDDGSYGEKGFVTQKLKELIDSGNTYDEVVAIGPGVMMKAVSETTRPYGIKTLVSLNPIMIDGTGMCGGCRVTVGGETRFACVDGPEFDGHLVDWDELIKRGAFYRDEETESRDSSCRLLGGTENV